MIVSDNGTCSSSHKFQTFVKQNGIQHVRTAAYHPSSNGIAERYVQIVKDGLKKMISGSVESQLARLLSCYRVTPQSMTGVSPAELMFGRKLRTRLDLLQPDLGNRVRQQQARQKQNHDIHSKHRNLEAGMAVYVLNNHGTPKWLPGTIQQITGPASVLVKLRDGHTFHRHIDDIDVRTTQDLDAKFQVDADTTPDSLTSPTQTVPHQSTRTRRPTNHYV